MTNSQSTSLAKIRNENGFYDLTKLKAWAKKFKLQTTEKIGVSPKDDHIAIFKRSYNQSSQVFICIGGKTTEITAV